MASTTVHYWTGSAWSDAEANQVKVKITDTLFKPKFAEITIADLDNAIQDAGNYSPYTRIKIVETNINSDPNSTAKPIFFGRVEFVEIRNIGGGGSSLVLQCRDFLSELDEASISRDFSGPTKLGALVKDIVDYYTYTEVAYKEIADGTFTVNEHITIGNWVKVVTDGIGGIGRIIHVGDIVGATGVLVLTDVINAQSFVDDGVITEYTDASCETATSVTAKCDGDLVSWIDTTDEDALSPTLGTIEATATTNYVKASFSPLEAITQLCLHGSSTGVYNFFLDVSSDSTCFPPVFTLFLRESRPSASPSVDGLSIEYDGTNDLGGQDRVMFPEFKFPEPDREIYTEAFATTLNSDEEVITSTKKAGSVAYALKIFKKREFQAIEHYTQDGLDYSVDRVIAFTGISSIQRGVVSFGYYPYFKKDSDPYVIVHTGDTVYIKANNIDYAKDGVAMLVTEIDYEEPNGTTSMKLLETGKGLGPAEYVYPTKTIGTSFPISNIDVRIPALVPAWNELLPRAVQGYRHDLVFVSVDADTVSWDAGTITFYDGTTRAISSGNTSTLADTDPRYIYFDLDDANPDVLKVATVDAYSLALSSVKGVVCLVQKAEDDDRCSVFPSYGKEPLITADVIHMAGLKNWDNGAGARYQLVLDTQISSGNLKLTALTVKDKTWYDATGVTIDASSGIDIYGTNMAFTTSGSKVISSIVTSGGSSILVTTSTNHGLEVDDSIKIVGTVNYNGSYTVATQPSTTTFTVVKAFVENEDTGAVRIPQCYVGSDGKIYAGAGTVRMDSTGLELWNAAGTVQVVDFASDGSGWIGISGTKAMSWTTAGVVTIGGLTITDDKMYIGTGTFENSNTTFYVDNAGQFSLKDKLVWDGTTLEITGAVTATSGTIGSWSIDATSIYTGTEDHGGYTANAGDITIYSDGANASIHAKHFYIDSSGDLTATNVNITGAITATSGSFAGSLSAATGSFAGSLSAVTGSFAGDISAATGTFSGTVTAGGGGTPIVLSSSGMTITNQGGGYAGVDSISFFVLGEGSARGSIYCTDGSFAIVSPTTGDFATDIVLQGSSVRVLLPIGGALEPYAAGYYDLGNSVQRWRNIHGTVILRTSIYGDPVDGMLKFVGDGTGNLVVYENLGWVINTA